MGTVLLFIVFEPLLIIPRMAPVSAVLAPNHEPLAQPPLTDHTQQVALAVSLCHRALARSTLNTIPGVVFSDVGKLLCLGQHDCLSCDLKQLQASK